MARIGLIFGIWLGWAAGAQGFDVERFFADNLIVDGRWTIYEETPGKAGHPYPLEKGPWDLGPLKYETGCIASKGIFGGGIEESVRIELRGSVSEGAEALKGV